MKKIIAVIFIVIASILSLAFLSQVPRLISLIPPIFSGNVNDWAFLLGSLVAAGLVAGAAGVFFLFGSVLLLVVFG